MASCLRSVIDSQGMQNELNALKHQTELEKMHNYIKARKIQFLLSGLHFLMKAWFRGIATRNHIRMLNAMATIIQRHWRGYRARFIVRKMLADRVKVIWKNRYNVLATRIQAIWRGYRARKNGTDVRWMKQWTTYVYEQNDICRDQMRRFREDQLESARNEMDSESLEWLLFILFKVHHLLSSKNRPGIVLSTDHPHLTTIEKMIKCLKYSDYLKKKRIHNIYCKEAK